MSPTISRHVEYNQSGAIHNFTKNKEVQAIFNMQAEPMDVDQGAAFDPTALNGTTSPADGTSISPYGTRRSVGSLIIMRGLIILIC